MGKVCAAYKPGNKVKRTFRADGAIAFDDRILTWNRGQQVVSIWTVKGRLKIPFEAGPRQTELLKSRQGESDLILHKGVFYLAATCHVGRPESAGVEGFLASRSWRCRDCRYQGRKEVQRRSPSGASGIAIAACAANCKRSRLAVQSEN